MYEPHVTALRNSITDVDITFDTEPEYEPPVAFDVTVTFAAFTDQEAWITITDDGTVHPAFGGTGTSPSELDEYAEQAVELWRTITGNHDATCRYAAPDSNDHGREIPA